MVFIHGGLVNSDLWDPQFDYVSRNCRAIRFDIPGLGRSTAPPGQFAYHDLVHALLVDLKATPAVLVGLSMGGEIAVNTALCYPSAVSGLFLAGSSLSGFEIAPPPAEYRAAMAAAERAGIADAGIELLLRRWTDGPNRTPDQVSRGVREKVREMTKINFPLEDAEARSRPLDPPASGRLRDVKAPTLVTYGTEDVEAIKEIGEMIAAGVPGARLSVIEGAAHHMNLEKPHEFNELLGGFLRQFRD